MRYEPSDKIDVLFNLYDGKADQNSVGFAHMGYLDGSTGDSATCAISDTHKGSCTSVTGQGQVKYDPSTSPEVWQTVLKPILKSLVSR